MNATQFEYGYPLYNTTVYGCATIDECRAANVEPCEDPAVFLILHQLDFILTGDSQLGDLGMYMGAMDALELKLKED